ncbi:MAG: HD domain-containing protein [Thermoplasmatales archaeon]|nr:HD domain-containing protein [Thermoplasmatales archaeon]
MSAKALDIDLVYVFFDAANMDRWNDHIRPINLTELDKQAHKAAIAWYLGKCEELRGNEIDWRAIVEGGMFSFIQRTILTDLKPPLFHRIKKERAKEVNDFVVSEFGKNVPNVDPALSGRFEAYLRKDDRKSLESQVLRAAHYLATKWEFDFIYDVNRRIYGIEETRENIESQIGQHIKLAGVRKILDGDWENFAGLIAQLRFQKRWARTPRVPETTVLGHSLLVANMVYLHDLDRGVDDATMYNDYYAAIFHDLPEVFTRDVISPVKANVGGLMEILEDYEADMVGSVVVDLLEEEWADGFRFLILDPFSEKDDPVHGKLHGREVKACDLMAAFLEANISLRHGITSEALRTGAEELRVKLLGLDTTIDTAELIRRFDAKDI